MNSTRTFRLCLTMAGRSFSRMKGPVSEIRSPIAASSPVQSAAANGAGAGSWLLLVAPGVIWGASFLFIAEALRSVGPNGVTFGRILIGFATLALFPAARRPLPREAWPGTALLGLIWMAFP